MSTTVSRKIRSVPERTTTETWDFITDLLTPTPGPGRTALENVANIAGMLISEGYTGIAPIVVRPASGPRVRVWTLHGEDAIAGDGAENPLATQPLAQDGWSISLPCGEVDLADVAAALDAHPGISVRPTADGLTVEDDEPNQSSAATGSDLVINLDALRRA